MGWFMKKVAKRSGVRTPWRIMWKKVKCFLFTHGEIGDAGSVTSGVRGSRPVPLRQCLTCGEFLMQRTNKNTHVKAV
jgi:hypothetical protein